MKSRFILCAFAFLAGCSHLPEKSHTLASEIVEQKLTALEKQAAEIKNIDPKKEDLYKQQGLRLVGNEGILLPFKKSHKYAKDREVVFV
ncbi:hypothetical protein AGMMS49949_06960 [Alphaproteobacteria bacterium]|nr:hypothetical protein AGMMS49949_06960 [Alphaproteobacteria bacterium]GHS99244.1 hypothetical protein AGMMS50296_7330 [Alphaproteobacteria bacterium]